MGHMSKLGLAFSGIFIVAAVYLIATQGLFGESFIALILGLPWVLVFAFFEFGGAAGWLTYIFVLAPIALNAAVLYFIGALLERVFTRMKKQGDSSVS